MGNRAVICTGRKPWGVYLHVNGGRDSVEAFLNYCKLKGYRSPENDDYGWARLLQVIGNFFGGSYSAGFELKSHLDCDNGDNGVYVIKNWEIVGREHFDGLEQQNYDLFEFMCEIDSNMPPQEQVGYDAIKKYVEGRCA